MVELTRWPVWLPEGVPDLARPGVDVEALHVAAARADDHRRHRREHVLLISIGGPALEADVDGRGWLLVDSHPPTVDLAAQRGNPHRYPASRPVMRLSPTAQSPIVLPRFSVSVHRLQLQRLTHRDADDSPTRPVGCKGIVLRYLPRSGGVRLRAPTSSGGKLSAPAMRLRFAGRHAAHTPCRMYCRSCAHPQSSQLTHGYGGGPRSVRRT